MLQRHCEQAIDGGPSSTVDDRRRSTSAIEETRRDVVFLVFQVVHLDIRTKNGEER